MPTTDHSEEEVGEMYDNIEGMLNLEKGNDYLIVLGDFNTIVGEGSDGLVAGRFDLGSRNDRGDVLIEFCKRRNLIIANTWFEHKLRGRYTWNSPRDIRRLQIDYIFRDTAKV